MESGINYILSIDQGTSGTKALLFDTMGMVVRKTWAPLHTSYSSNGFAEQGPQDILQSVRQAVGEVVQDIRHEEISAVSISNQRETFVLWDGRGSPVYPAIVWSCKRSVGICTRLKPQEDWLHAKTGLLADPYFSGSKLLWIMEHKPELKARIEAGEIYFGTVDTWLLYNLTNGGSYLTDHTNASRTLFFNLEKLEWDAEILEKWNLTALRLPEVRPSASEFGKTDVFGTLSTEIPVLAMIGDSHAALFGEACFEPGDTKVTMGTGCSLLSNAGDRLLPGREGLLNTVAWSSADGVVYAREGAIVSCGSMVEWLQKIGIVQSADESSLLAKEADAASQVSLVPAFSGLGAPFWQMERQASFHGLSFGTSRAELVRATLESICFQIRAVLDAMERDGAMPIRSVAIHGGLSRNGFIRDCLAMLLDSEIRIQDNPDISAQGAAFLAGLQGGVFSGLAAVRGFVKSKKLAKAGGADGIREKYQQWLRRIESKNPAT